nr:replication associated protein [Flumine microvirus 25]
MKCFAPWFSVNGGGSRPMSCGDCIGCRLNYAREWSIRCWHEAQLHDVNSFVTLTYRDAPLSLEYRDFQLFMKRLRKWYRGEVRFYMCGEYGDNNGRAHFHACLFGVRFPDLVYHSTTAAGFKLYVSAKLEQLWGHGFCTVGDVTLESAGYCARYVGVYTGNAKIMEIVDVDTGEIHQRVRPFARMSLRPGIGSRWYDRFKADVYPHGAVVVNGVEVAPPKYYDRKFRSNNFPAYSRMLLARDIRSRAAIPESFPGRVEAHLAVKRAQLSSLHRDV